MNAHLVAIQIMFSLFAVKLGKFTINYFLYVTKHTRLPTKNGKKVLQDQQLVQSKKNLYQNMKSFKYI